MLKNDLGQIVSQVAGKEKGEKEEVAKTEQFLVFSLVALIFP